MTKSIFLVRKTDGWDGMTGHKGAASKGRSGRAWKHVGRLTGSDRRRRAKTGERYHFVGLWGRPSLGNLKETAQRNQTSLRTLVCQGYVIVTNDDPAGYRDAMSCLGETVQGRRIGGIALRCLIGLTGRRCLL